MNKEEIKKTKLILNKLVKCLCSLEGGKVQLNAGQAREVITKMAMIACTDDVGPLFNEYVKCVKSALRVAAELEDQSIKKSKLKSKKNKKK